MKCASKISIDEDSCLPKCSGLLISNFIQDSIEKNKNLFKNMDLFNKMHLDILAKLEGKVTGNILPPSLTSWRGVGIICINTKDLFPKF